MSGNSSGGVAVTGKSSSGGRSLSVNADSAYVPVDVFAKSEKWKENPPIPNTSSWTTREGEILGWNSYINDLTAWSMQVSLELRHEIQQALKWHEPI